MTKWISNSSLYNQNKNIRILNIHTEFNDNVDSNIAYTNLDKNESSPSETSLFLDTSYNYLDISKKKMNHDKDENKRNHNSKAEFEIKELIKKEIEKNNKTGEEEEHIKKNVAHNKINRDKKERDTERYEEDNDEIDEESDDEEDEEKDKPKDKKIKKLIHHEIRKINEKIEKDIQEREEEKSHHEIKGHKTIAIEIKNENTHPKIKCSNKLNYIELESLNIDKNFTSENNNNDVISFINIKTKDKISFIDKINENIAKIKDNYDINKISNVEQMEVEPNDIKKDQKIVDDQIKNKNKVQDNAILHNNNHSFLDSKEYNKYHIVFNNNLKNINKHINAHKYNNLNGTVKSNDRIKSGFTNFLMENQEDDSHPKSINFGRRSSVLNITNDEYSKLLNEGSVLVYDKDEVVPYKYDAFEVKDDNVDDMKNHDNNNNNNSHIDENYTNDIASQNTPEEEDQLKGMILTCVTVIIILTIIILIGFIIYYYDIINKIRVKLQKKGTNNKSMTIKNDTSSGMYIDNYYDDSTHA
ncbi:conserved Plasmodium protein, unknown function [Plasmodium vinckei vinckei]|uniref:Uncharacterized protein n=1 Tax=Plasmodium vinckei vinckei TaxID=54757 RepID=A0A449BUU1_PLAVN|nr:conserved Plasmodium protein, unknown function [Plasmodium vinckei vinckei]VEV57237.1 conserved Plasmodium protein, unknown function [Plasmodium vinckei vinckei]